MSTTVTSLTLLEALRGGADERAWREFFRLYAPMLLSFAKRLGLSDADAHDAVQDTMVAVHAAFKEAGQPFDRTKGRFKSWLRGVAQHKVRDLLRRRRSEGRTEALGGQAATLQDTNAAGLDAAFELEWQRNLLGQALDQAAQAVDPAAYQAFELCALHGQPAEKVASLLGVSRNAVYISKTRVLQKVRGILAELQQTEG